MERTYCVKINSYPFDFDKYMGLIVRFILLPNQFLILPIEFFAPFGFLFRA
ncbi:hypothetical protein SAMN05216323_104817 [Williamwhitmania taraxaci]|uniref:Uncharacterized protein n=1 Tax=Williamwhitmania taraxaci TaxID=1640674 RepID=A0A1G6P3I6_9BACT|nr:hypothetical protein SAMN05216323_104817 [Williamwhitmania taraxaci]